MVKNNTQFPIINMSSRDVVNAIPKDALSVMFRCRKNQWSKVMALSRADKENWVNTI